MHALHIHDVCVRCIFIMCACIAYSCIKSEHSGVAEMALGGVVYICGIAFFKSDGVIPFAHAIWHCFVFLGALMHFSAVCNYLLSPANYHCASPSELQVLAVAQEAAGHLTS